MNLSIDKIIVLSFGITGVVFTYWFFLLKKQKTIKVQDQVDVIVDGGYSPEVISIPKDKLTKINFIRKDSNSCLEEVVLNDFNIKKSLPLDQKVTIELTPRKSGEYRYSCGMNMYHGKIIVR